jgi:hypothetical protein
VEELLDSPCSSRRRRKYPESKKVTIRKKVLKYNKYREKGERGEQGEGDKSRPPA